MTTLPFISNGIKVSIYDIIDRKSGFVLFDCYSCKIHYNIDESLMDKSIFNVGLVYNNIIYWEKNVRIRHDTPYSNIFIGRPTYGFFQIVHNRKIIGTTTIPPEIFEIFYEKLGKVGQFYISTIPNKKRQSNNFIGIIIIINKFKMIIIGIKNDCSYEIFGLLDIPTNKFIHKLINNNYLAILNEDITGQKTYIMIDINEGKVICNDNIVDDKQLLSSAIVTIDATQKDHEDTINYLLVCLPSTMDKLVCSMIESYTRE